MHYRVLNIFILLTFFCASSFSQQKHFLYKVIGQKEGLQSAVALGTMQDSRGLVWIYTYDGLYTYDGFRAVRKEVRYCDTCAPSGDFIYGILELPKGKYWMLTPKGVGTFQPLSGLFTLVKSIPNIMWCSNMEIANDSCIRIQGCSRQPLLFNVINGRIIQEEGILYEGFWDLLTPTMGLEDYFRQYPAMQSYTLNGTKSPAQFWIKDFEKNIWCIDGTGLLLFQPGNERYIAVGEQYPVFSGGTTNSIRLDPKGILWLTVQGTGVVMLDTKGTAFNNLTSKSKPISLTKDFVLGIYPLGNDEIAIYPQFATPERATILNTKDMTAQIRKGDKALSDRISAILFATGSGGEALKKSWISAPLKENVINFFLGKNGRDYEITGPGLILKSSSDQKELLQGFSQITLKYLGDTLWFGTESHGLVAIDLNTSAVSTFQPSAADGGGFDTWTVFGILPDGPDHLWLATSRGLWHFDKTTRGFTGYGTKDGLPHAYIYCLTKDLNGRLWLGTGNGLSCFDPKTKSFRNFFPADGIVNTEYNRLSAYTAKDGRVFMGGSHGVDYFYPDQLFSDSFTARPFFSAIMEGETLLDPEGNIKLGPGKNNLTFYLGVDQPFKADKYKMEWQLAGSGEDWKEVGASNTLNLANLAPNDYLLKVRLIDPNGNKASKETAYPFSIAPFWYQSRIFWLFAVLVSTGLLSWLLAYRQQQKIKRLRQENIIMRLKAEQEALLREERERITADLHDDTGATLSSLYIYSDLVKRMTPGEQEESRKLLDKMIGASQGLMLRMSDIIWSLKPVEEEKNTLYMRLMNYAQELFSNGETEIKIDIDHDLDVKMVHPTVRKNVSLMVKEALNNAAKYSKAKNIFVSLHQQGEEVVLVVQDDGVGFDPYTIKKGNGLDNMQRRAAQLNGNLTVNTQPGKGATLTFRFPITIISYFTEMEAD